MQMNELNRLPLFLSSEWSVERAEAHWERWLCLHQCCFINIVWKTNGFGSNYMPVRIISRRDWWRCHSAWRWFEHAVLFWSYIRFVQCARRPYTILFAILNHETMFQLYEDQFTSQARIDGCSNKVAINSPWSSCSTTLESWGVDLLIQIIQSSRSTFISTTLPRSYNH